MPTETGCKNDSPAWPGEESKERLSRVGLLSARLVFALFVLMTSVYCVLAYVPFTYHWVIKCPVVAWLPLFARFTR